MRFAAALLASLLTLPGAALAAPVGIAFAQAEEGTWWCRGDKPAEAIACAFDKCVASGGKDSCTATRWCTPAAWSGLMVVWLPEFHATIPLCGTPSRDALVEGFRALCANDEVVTRCDVVAAIDPDGKEEKIGDLSWPGPTIAPPPPTTK
jgi:hypothetical protein